MPQSPGKNPGANGVDGKDIFPVPVNLLEHGLCSVAFLVEVHIARIYLSFSTYTDVHLHCFHLWRDMKPLLLALDQPLICPKLIEAERWEAERWPMWSPLTLIILFLRRTAQISPEPCLSCHSSQLLCKPGVGLVLSVPEPPWASGEEPEI